MGNEYEEYPKEIFKSWANMMLDAGADIVVASHPHVLQPMEMVDITNDDGTVRKGFIMYSLEILFLHRQHLQEMQVFY